MLAAGLAIMAAALAELDVHRINPVGGALRLGVLYDLLGRQVRRDVRVATIDQFAARYRIDREHAARVAAMAVALHAGAAPGADPAAVQRLEWAALLHETGFSVSHTGYHKHGAYILQNADMPGFSAGEQHDLAMLVLGCRGGLSKMAPVSTIRGFARALVALRLAVLVSPRAARHRAAEDRHAIRRADPRERARALAEGASADRAPAGPRARRMDGGGLSDALRLNWRWRPSRR